MPHVLLQMCIIIDDDDGDEVLKYRGTELLKYLPCKYEGVSLLRSSYVTCLSSHIWGCRDRQISGDSWPLSLAYCAHFGHWDPYLKTNKQTNKNSHLVTDGGDWFLVFSYAMGAHVTYT